MKVLQLLPSVSRKFGGPVRSTMATLDAVHQADASVKFVLLSTERDLDSEWETKIRNALPPGSALELFPAAGPGATLFSPSLVARVLKTATSFDLAVFRTLLNPLVAAAARAALYCSLPYVLVPHGTLSRYTFSYRRTLLKRLWWRAVDRKTAGQADYIRFTASGEEQEARRLGLRTLVRTVPHPFSSDMPFTPVSERKKELILFLSRLHPKKGLDLLLPAFARVRALRPNARLVVAGSGPAEYEERVRTWIRELHLDEAVCLPGFVTGEEKRKLLSEATVFVLPSRQENFGVAIAEAMHSGLPVVTTRTVDIWPDIRDFGAGLLPDLEVPALAEALDLLLGDPEFRDRAGRAGYRLVEKRYAPEVVGPSILEMYRETGSASGPSH